MKRMNDNSRATEFFIKAGLIVALAAIALMPTTIRVHGNGVLIEQDRAMPKRGSWNDLPLPPISHLETMPWLVQDRAPKGLKIDPLLAPRFEMDPAVAGEADDCTPSTLAQRG
jgi:hypothetical protein